MNKLISIEIIRDADIDPDLSYLEPGMNPEYDTENAERLAQYGDYWTMIGIYAQAVVHVPTAQGGYSSMQTLRTPGLWGIESDSDRSYFQEVGREELCHLMQILTEFNVSLDGWEKLAADAIDAIPY